MAGKFGGRFCRSPGRCRPPRGRCSGHRFTAMCVSCKELRKERRDDGFGTGRSTGPVAPRPSAQDVPEPQRIDRPQEPGGRFKSGTPTPPGAGTVPPLPVLWSFGGSTSCCCFRRSSGFKARELYLRGKPRRPFCLIALQNVRVPRAVAQAANGERTPSPNQQKTAGAQKQKTDVRRARICGPRRHGRARFWLPGSERVPGTEPANTAGQGCQGNTCTRTPTRGRPSANGYDCEE